MLWHLFVQVTTKDSAEEPYMVLTGSVCFYVQRLVTHMITQTAVSLSPFWFHSVSKSPPLSFHCSLKHWAPAFFPGGQSWYFCHCFHDDNRQKITETVCVGVDDVANQTLPSQKKEKMKNKNMCCHCSPPAEKWRGAAAKQRVLERCEITWV